MKIIAVIEKGVVANVIKCGDGYTMDANMVDVTDTNPRPGPGWSYADKAFSRPQKPEVIELPQKSMIEAVNEKIDALISKMESVGMIPSGSVSSKTGIKNG